MPIELKVPEVGESISEVEIGAWLKSPGDSVQKDETVVTLESEKATVELPSPEAGTLGQILKHKGETAKVGQVIGYLTSGPQNPATPARERKSEALAPEFRERRQAASAATPQTAGALVMPAAEALLAELNLRPEQVHGTGPGGRILKEDVLRYLDQVKASQPGGPSEAPAPSSARAPTTSEPTTAASMSGREEEIVPMSRLRRTVAERLVAAQQAAALLTTFNEVDMSSVMALRKEFGEAFQKRYNVKLGFMSFFVKACIDGLKLYPAVNAQIRGTNILYHNYCDIGVAVGSGKGLVVPVLRNAERMSFAEVEMAIGDFARRAGENKLKVEELQGGTFTISNGGVYGSMLSTPIVNPPQSGVLGMHAIQDRPVVVESAVVIRPIMYVALSYDHRLVDGRQAVSFLRRVKGTIENPTRMLIEI